MRTTADHDPQVTVHVSRSRMRAVVQIVGGVVLGLGLLLLEDPDTANDRHDHSCSRHR
jgi:hypothetical protein